MYRSFWRHDIETSGLWLGVFVEFFGFWLPLFLIYDLVRVYEEKKSMIRAHSADRESTRHTNPARYVGE